MSLSHFTRREFLNTLAKASLAATAANFAGGHNALASSSLNKKKVALVGTGIRGTGMWAHDLLRNHGERVEMVGLCDLNRMRAALCQRYLGGTIPAFTDLDLMLKTTKPHALIIATKDSTHHEQIIRGLEAGCEVITEKPMTTDAQKCRAILEAEKRTGKRVAVTFNYRYSTIAEKLKKMLMENTIGTVTSVDFHWYLDVYHGADYFRRWHAYKESSGTLFVHKATHHFDLVNWYLEADPVEVSARGELRKYGRNGAFRGRNCRTCSFQKQCEFYWDIQQEPELVALYADCESEDGYLRDACVFRNDIDIYDTMVAHVRYSNGALMSYSLNAFMPYEGFQIAFNGTKGRIEARVFERQPWEEKTPIVVRVTKNFGGAEVFEVQEIEEGHGGGDGRMQRMLFDPTMPDPYKQRADSRAGAMSILTGIAAVQSVETGRAVKIEELLRG